MENITLYMQPKQQYICSKNFIYGTIDKVDRDEIEIEIIIKKMLPIFFSAVSIAIILILYQMLNLYTVCLIFVYIAIITPITNRHPWYYFVPYEYFFLSKRFNITKGNKEISLIKTNFSGLPHNWAVLFNNGDIIVRFEYTHLIGFGDSYNGLFEDPENHIIILQLEGNRTKIKEIAEYLINHFPEPWNIIHLKSLEKRYNISLPEV